MDMMQLDDGLSVQLMAGQRCHGLHKMMLEVHRGVSFPSHTLAYVVARPPHVVEWFHCMMEQDPCGQLPMARLQPEVSFDSTFRFWT
jgi:hypothetical protein